MTSLTTLSWGECLISQLVHHLTQNVKQPRAQHMPRLFPLSFAPHMKLCTSIRFTASKSNGHYTYWIANNQNCIKIYPWLSAGNGVLNLTKMPSSRAQPGHHKFSSFSSISCPITQCAESITLIAVRSFSTTCRRRWTGTPSGRPTTMSGPTLPKLNGESIADILREGFVIR